MNREMYDFLVEFMEEHGGMPEGIMEQIEMIEEEEEKLDVLIGLLCMPEHGGIEMVRGILGLEFDAEDFEDLIDMNFDRFY